MDQKSITEGGRALVYWGASMIDRSHRMDDEDAEAMISLLIPVMKGFLTDKGFDTRVLAQQTLGGSGFTKEWGLEQFVRDARIAMIYEGTNGIQSLDLVGRKLPQNGGKIDHGVLRDCEDFHQGKRRKRSAERRLPRSPEGRVERFAGGGACTSCRKA